MSVFAFAEPVSGWRTLGHERAVRMLQRAIATGSVSHAYLFAGPDGVGKRKLAMEFAMALNCQATPPPDLPAPYEPCYLCRSCSLIQSGTHPDVHEISLERQRSAEPDGKAKGGTPKEIRIGAIRDLQSTVGLSPHSGRCKVYIIADADRMNEEASNCLLKTLEEPPQHTVLILLAPSESAVLPTISSRCLLVPLRPLSRLGVAEALRRGLSAEPHRIELAAALSGGRLGAAISLLSDTSRLDLRNAALQTLAALSGAPVAERIEVATGLAKQFTDERAELYSLLATWEIWWRDLALVQAGQTALVTNVDQLEVLHSWAARTTLKQAHDSVKLIEAVTTQLMENVNPRLALEALTLGLP